MTDMDIEATIDSGISTSETKRDKNKHSRFHLTINTNKRFRDKGEAKNLSEKLLGKMNEVFRNIENYVLITDENGRFNKTFFDRPNIVFRVEEGHKLGFIHLHALIDITHRTKIKINIGAFHEALHEIGINGRVFLKLLQGNFSLDNTKEYIFKHSL